MSLDDSVIAQRPTSPLHGDSAEHAMRERLHLAQRAARIGTFDWDVRSGRVAWTEEEERLFGIAPGTFGGTIDDWAAFVHPDDLPRMRAGMQAAMARGDAEMAFAFRIRRPDGALRWIEGSALFTYADDGAPLRMVGVNVDVTSRRVAEERTRRLLELGAVLAASETPHATIAAAVETALGTMGAASAAFFLLEEDGQHLRVTDARGFAREYAERHARIPMDADFPVVDAVRSLAPVVLPSPAEIARRYPALAAPYAAQHIDSAIVVPLLAAGRRVLGAFGVGWDAARDILPDEVEFVELVAGQAAQALERARLLVAERRARQQAEEASRAKSEFLAVMSHELRTPLNAILGYQDLLDVGVAGALTAGQRQYVDRVRHSARHLLSLINRVLSFSRLDAHAVEYDLARVPVALLLQTAEPLVAPQVAEKAIAFSVDAGPPGLAAIADVEKATQVLLNLVGNAVKFTGTGGTIAIAAAPATGQRVAIRVRDTGEGIPADKLEAIFEPFRQVDTHFARRTAGTGLGLAISRALARGMGGELTVESRVGEGSTFTLWLPGA